MDWKTLLKENKILNNLNGFNGKYKILSNFAVHKSISIVLPYGNKNGKIYYANNVETLFQAAKTLDSKEIEMIVKSNNPSISKRLGRKCKLRNDWEEIKEEVMKDLLLEKYNAFIEFRQILLSIPNDKYIVEMNTWNDKEWGVCVKTLIGDNKLGKLLMELKRIGEIIE